MLTPNSELLHQIQQLAQQAGEHLLNFYQHPLKVHTKSDHTPVTAADLFVSQFLTEKLTALFPHIPVLSEENCQISWLERQQWAQYWLIDPLDGTQQFINRTDQFAVLISLVQRQLKTGRNLPTLSVIHAPVLNQTYTAAIELGAHKITATGIHPLCAEATNIFPQRLKIAVGETTSQPKVRSILRENIEAEFIVLGSSSLKSGLVAEGNADCYIRLGKTGEWDTACAEILLAESGGAVFDFNYQPLTYNQRPSLVNPPFVMVRNKTLNWQDIFRFE